jgi:hypothetical protein
MNQYFGDPDDCYDRKDHDDAESEKRCPTCCVCGNPITFGHYYEDDYGIFCPDDWADHVADEYRKSAEEYIQRKANE